MRATVADVLEVPAVRSASPTVLGGGEMLGRTVRWMHTTDGTDLSGLLKGGEMILTAGESFTGTIWEAMAYFENLVSNGASGVMVSLLSGGVEAKSVLREAARTAKLPVILLRDRVPFVELTEAVHRVLLAADPGEGSEANPALLIDQLSVENASPSEILRRTSELLLAPVVYEDVHHRVVAYATAGIHRDRLLAGWAQRSSRVPSGDRLAGGEWLQVGYRENDEPMGRLVVPMRLIDPSAPAILERAAQVLEHCYANFSEMAAPRFRAAIGAFQELRASQFSDEASATLRAEASGIAAAVEYIPIVLRCETAPAESTSQYNADALVGAAYLVALESGISLIAAALSPTSVGGVLGVSEGADWRELLQRFARDVDRQAGGALGTGTWLLAIGRRESTLRDAVDAGVDEASAVAEAASGMDTRLVPYVTAGDVRLRRLLQSMSGEERIREFAEESLAGLKEEGPEYLRILRTYIELNGNIAEVARAVYLSRPSVYVRLNRIEEIVGASLNNVDTRMGLYVALLADAYWETRGRSTP